MRLHIPENDYSIKTELTILHTASNSRQERNSSIELLRIIAMMGVVILHYNNAGIGGGLKYVAPGTVNSLYLSFSMALFCCAVNLFIMISAYFLSATDRRKPGKILELFVQVILFSLAFNLMGMVKNREFSTAVILRSFLPTNYFVILYSTLYLISPYINLAVRKLTKRQFFRMVILLFALFSLWTTAVDILSLFGNVHSMSPVSANGPQAGYTIVNFALCYVIAAYIRTHTVTFSEKMKAILFAVCLGGIFCMSFLTEIAYNYSNPLVIAMAAIVLIIFKDIRFHSKAVNELAKGAFTCFLFHGPF